MPTGSPHRRALAGVLVVVMAVVWVPAHAAPASANLTGVVLSSEDQTALQGARVYVADRNSGKVFPADPTSEHGRFSLGDLPPSTYDIAVEINGGLFLVQQRMPLAAGENQHVNIAVDARKDIAPAAQPAATNKTSVWNNPLTAALIVVGAAIVVGAIVENATDDEDQASP